MSFRFVCWTVITSALCCWLSLGASAVQAQNNSLSATENNIVAYVDSHGAEALAFLERIVNVNSGSLNFDGVREVGRMFEEPYAALGFETRWVDGAEFGRAGHFVARRNGSSGPTVLLIGHLDTVFERESPFQRFAMVSDSMASGPGIADMKGGDVIILQALRALQAAEVLDDLTVIVVMTGDEERSGRPLDLARKALVDAAIEADIAIGFENGDGNPATAVVARRSSSSWTLRVTGTPAHSSQVFTERVGAGAIYEASRILMGFYERLRSEKNLTFNPGVILGGTDVDFDPAQARGSAFGKNNVVAEHAMVSGDLRAISPEQIEYATRVMQDVVGDSLPQTRAELTFSEGYPPLAPTDGNYELLHRFSVVSEDLGFGPVAPVDPRNAGAADIAFTSDYVDMAIDGIGLGGADDHTVDETGHLWTLPMQTKRAAVLLYRLARQYPN